MIYIIIIIIGIIGWILYFRQHATQISINLEVQKKNQQLDEEYKAKQKKLSEIQDRIGNQSNVLKSIISSSEDLKNNATKNAENAGNKAIQAMKHEYDKKEEELLAKFIEKEKNLKTNYAKQKAEYDDEIEKINELLKDLKDKYTARMEAALREQEIKSKQDYYRLNISDQDKEDIQCLRQLQGRLGRRDAIDKLIWDVYYKPAYDALMPRLSASASKLCGIYKITNTTTGMAYIGQSVDIKERFRQHIKAAISSSPATNKLYQAMKEYGLYDFTFEILEKDIPRTKLNERETYWIDFYDTKKFGLNKTVGGS